MATNSVDVGTGAYLRVGTSSGSGGSADSWVVEINDISHSTIELPVIDTTHLGTTTARSFIPGNLYDPGEATFTIHLDPGQSALPTDGTT